MLNSNLAAANDKLDRQLALINRQNDSITNQYRTIHTQQDSLKITNLQLSKERDNLLLSNRLVLINESKLLAKMATTKCDEGNFMEARRLALSALPKDLSNPDRPFVVEAEAALRRSFERDEYPIRTLKPRKSSMSPDGKEFAEAWFDGISIFDATTGEKLHDWIYFHDQDSPCNLVSYNEDGTKLLIPSWGGAVTIDSKTGKIIDFFSNPVGGITSLQYNKDYSKILSLGDSLIIFSANDKRILFSKKIHSSGIGSIDYCDAIFAPTDDNQVIMRDYTTIKQIDTKSGETTILISTDGREIHSFDVHPQGRYIAVQIDTSLIVYDLSLGKRNTLAEDMSMSEGVAFDVEGKYLFAGNFFFKTDTWQRYNLNDQPSISTNELPLKYSGIKYMHENSTHATQIVELYKKGDQDKVPNYVISALKHSKWGIPTVYRITYSNSDVTLVDFDYDNESYLPYGALFEGERLIRIFRIVEDCDDRTPGFSETVLNYDGKYYGYEVNETTYLYETISGKQVGKFPNFKLVYDRYIFTIDYNKDDYKKSDICLSDICLYDKASGLEVQRLKGFPEWKYDISITIQKSIIYIYSDSIQISYEFKSIQELIDQASLQFRNYGKRKRTALDYVDELYKKESLLYKSDTDL